MKNNFLWKFKNKKHHWQTNPKWYGSGRRRNRRKNLSFVKKLKRCASPSLCYDIIIQNINERRAKVFRPPLPLPSCTQQKLLFSLHLNSNKITLRKIFQFKVLKLLLLSSPSSTSRIQSQLQFFKSPTHKMLSWKLEKLKIQ